MRNARNIITHHEHNGIEYARSALVCRLRGTEIKERLGGAIPSLRSYRRLTGVTESQPLQGW